MLKRFIIQRIFLSLFVVTMLLFLPMQHTLAATCYGGDCNNTNPHTTGCDVGAITIAYIHPASSRVDLRSSSTCATQWARTINTDGYGRSFYANATLKSFYYTYSPGPIGVAQQVYSNQQYARTNQQACGYVDWNILDFPVNSPCTQ